MNSSEEKTLFTKTSTRSHTGTVLIDSTEMTAAIHENIFLSKASQCIELQVTVPVLWHNKWTEHGPLCLYSLLPKYKGDIPMVSKEYPVHFQVST
jgi:hypothetical protein